MNGEMNISHEAVEAAYHDESANPRRAISPAEIYAILEAAAPHLTGAAWEEGYGQGYKHGYADCLKLYGHDTKEES